MYFLKTLVHFVHWGCPISWDCELDSRILNLLIPDRHDSATGWGQGRWVVHAQSVCSGLPTSGYARQFGGVSTDTCLPQSHEERKPQYDLTYFCAPQARHSKDSLDMCKGV